MPTALPLYTLLPVYMQKIMLEISLLDALRENLALSLGSSESKFSESEKAIMTQHMESFQRTIGEKTAAVNTLCALKTQLQSTRDMTSSAEIYSRAADSMQTPALRITQTQVAEIQKHFEAYIKMLTDTTAKVSDLMDIVKNN